MSKLPLGPRNVHIQKSQGADTNIMKFYITQNSTTYGAHFDKFQPRQGTHRGTGYLSNFRPSVFYNRRLDDVDNPAMRRICDGNYRSVTQLDYQPYRDSSGLDIFPGNVIQVPTGYVREKLSTFPLDRQVQGVFIDTRAAGAPANLLPKHIPLLHMMQNRDPIESENFGYGPRYMKTETQEKFGGQPWPSVDVSTKDIGPIQPSGFVRTVNDEPITFEPRLAYGNFKPGWYTHRPTGVSVTKTSFIPTKWSRGDDPLPGGISTGSDRGTGFTREEVRPKYVNIKPSDTSDRFHETPYLTHKQDDGPQTMESAQHEQFKGLMKPAPTEADRLNRTNFGIKTNTGFVRNNAPYVGASDDKLRFLTHYMTRYGPDPTPVGIDRAGHLRGGIQEMKSDGFTKSNTVNSFGKDPPSTEVLYRIEPYVGRSLKARSEFHDDHMYGSKTRTELIA